MCKFTCTPWSSELLEQRKLQHDCLTTLVKSFIMLCLNDVRKVHITGTWTRKSSKHNSPQYSALNLLLNGTLSQQGRTEGWDTSGTARPSCPGPSSTKPTTQHECFEVSFSIVFLEIPIHDCVHVYVYIYIYRYMCCRVENLSKNCPFLSWKSVQKFPFFMCVFFFFFFFIFFFQ